MREPLRTHAATARTARRDQASRTGLHVGHGRRMLRIALCAGLAFLPQLFWQMSAIAAEASRPGVGGNGGTHGPITRGRENGIFGIPPEVQAVV